MGQTWRVFYRKTRARAVTAALVGADVAALVLSVAAALGLRFEGRPFGALYSTYARPAAECLPVGALIYVAAFARLRLYGREWRFAGLEVLWRVVIANSIGIAGLAAYQIMVHGTRFPRSVIVVTWLGCILATGGSRIALRALCAARHRGDASALTGRKTNGGRRVVILGGGTLGCRVLRSIREDPSLADYRVIGFLDDDATKHGLYIGPALVLGPIDRIRELLRKRAMDEVIVALPEGSCGRLRDYVLECRRQQLPVRKVPYVRDALLSGGASLADFSVEDLLRRPQADVNTAEIAGYIRDRRVLITGAGGSIGSELCRQIARQSPASMILLGHGENSIYNIDQELRTEYPEVTARCHCVIADVSKGKRVDQVFSQFAPEVVFHAAAHKHVPMMESNCREAVLNNIIGTENVVGACGRRGVERMVMISTDKAADPCSVMGATKWVCEQVIRAGADAWPRTAFVTIRFGNVLGSRGSVVPMFRDQIRHGGPVTVTDPEMTRYFMTIPEAIRLVLQAGAVGESGRLYLLDMGEPVRILDLARDMICFCGLRPGVDIPIEFRGARPGERLHERLISDDECMEESQWPGLFHVRRNDYFAPAEMERALRGLQSTADTGSEAETLDCLRAMIPSFCAVEDEAPPARPYSHAGNARPNAV